MWQGQLLSIQFPWLSWGIHQNIKTNWVWGDNSDTWQHWPLIKSVTQYNTEPLSANNLKNDTFLFNPFALSPWISNAKEKNTRFKGQKVCFNWSLDVMYSGSNRAHFFPLYFLKTSFPKCNLAILFLGLSRGLYLMANPLKSFCLLMCVCFFSIKALNQKSSIFTVKPFHSSHIHSSYTK